MSDPLMEAAPWLLPLEFFAASAAVGVFCLKSPFAARINWAVVDFAWMLTSAVTLYFLAGSVLFDRDQATGQIAMNNFVTHAVRGEQLSNDNLEVFCLGASRRQAVVLPQDGARFCEFNVVAHGLFRQVLANRNDPNTVSRIPDADRVPLSAAASSPGQDALVLDERWKRVRDEMVSMNADFDEMKRLKAQGAWTGRLHRLRVGWLYLYCLLIAARLGKAIDDWRRGPRALRTDRAPADPSRTPA